MKLATIAATIIWATFSIGAQEQPVLVDEFRNSACDDLLVRVDVLRDKVAATSSSVGAVVFGSASDAAIGRARYFRKVIENVWDDTPASRDNLKFYLDDSKGIGVSFWVIPAGATFGVDHRRLWALPAFDTTKPVIFDTLQESICPSFSPKRYAEILRNDASLRSHIVIFSRDQRSERQEARYWLKELTARWFIDRRRVLMFRRRDRSLGIETTVQFWIVPPKRH